MNPELSQHAYGDLADIYDQIYHFKDYRKDVGYVVAEIRARLPDAGAVLDTACGTGNHIEVLKDDFEVEGLDLSARMLEIARRKHPGIQFHEASMIDFDLGRAYDVVTCLFRSIAYVRSVENLRSAIGAMARHVRPGGLLMIEPYFTPQTYWQDRVNLNESVQPDLKVAWMYVSARRDQLSILDMHYLVGTPAGVRHFTETHELGLFSPSDFRSAFEAAGLAFEYDPVGPTGTGFYVAKKTL